MTDTSEVKLYVLGFAFSENKQNILLVKKLHPDWQAGKLNGIGGKIEKGEEPRMAMPRESIEETGIDFNWKMFCVVFYPEALLHIFRAFSDDIYKVPKVNDVGEEHKIVSLNEFRNLYAISIYNLPYLVNLARDTDIDLVQITAMGEHHD